MRAALLIPVLALLMLALPGVASAGSFSAAPGATTTALRLMAINGLDGNLEPPGDTGGAAYLAAYLDQLRDGTDNAMVYSTGDNVGATPIASALFHDEPSIDFLNSQGLTASGIGYHDLYYGYDELARLQLGGCHPVDGCRFDDPFTGATFPIVGTNLTLPGGVPATLPFTVSFAGTTPVGTIAVLPDDIHTRVAQAGIRGLTAADPLDAVNRTADLLDGLGVHAIVLLAYGDIDVPANTPDGCADATGPLRRLIDEASPAVDVIFTGRIDEAFTCTFSDPDGNPRPVLQAQRGGTGIAVADVTIGGATGDILRDRTSMFTQTVGHDITPDPAAQALVERAVRESSAQAQQPVGTIAGDLPRSQDYATESAMGDVVADSQVVATAGAGAQIALTNPGGVRTGLAAGTATYGELFEVQPFRNPLYTMNLTGDQLTAVLEQQFQKREGREMTVLLAPSAGLTYTIDTTAPRGEKIRDVAVDGQSLAPDDTVRVTVNAFLAQGGDHFSVFADGTDVEVGGTDTDALLDYVRDHSPVQVPATERITWN